MKYDVHLYVAVRIKYEGIEADSQEAAVAKAEALHDTKDALRERLFADDEAPALGALVDEFGDESYEQTTYHELDGAQCYLDLLSESRLRHYTALEDSRDKGWSLAQDLQAQVDGLAGACERLAGGLG